MMKKTEFTIDELVACARREVAQRHRVYGRLVAFEKMTQEEAEREIALMKAIRENLEDQQQPRLF
jgi:uncharacterized membrane protein